MGRPMKDETGRKHGLLTVIRISSKRIRPSDGTIRWVCKCNCGNMHEASGADLRRGDVKSCGCLRGRKWREGM